MYVKIKKNLGKCLLDIVVVKSVACGRLVAHWSRGGSEGLIVKRMSRVAVVLHDLTAYGLAAELKMSGVKKNGKGDRRATVPCKQRIFYLWRRFKLHGWN